MRNLVARFTIVLILIISADAWSAPAAPIEFELTQPDGTTFRAVVRGDEYGSWVETVDGHSIVKKNDTWYYLERDGMKGVRASNFAVGRLSKTELDGWPRGLRPEIDSEAYKLRNPRRLLQRPPGLDGPLGVTQTQRVLTVLVDYTDIAFSNSDASFQSLIYSATDSVKEYFLENSYGEFEIIPAGENYGTANDGIIHVTRAANHPNSGQNFTMNRQEAGAIISLTDSDVNYADFDDDADGIISAEELSIVIILAGYERSFGGDTNAKTPSVWGHASSISSDLTLDNKSLAPYTMFGERHGTAMPDSEHQATIGIMCHELGHLMFDLPDLYDVDGSSFGIGNWGLMGGGSWNATGSFSGDTPAHLNAWSKAAVGMVTPLDVTSMEIGAGIAAADSSAFSRKLYVDPYRWREYFLLENRQLSGYDAGLPGSGLLIWHVDGTQTNNGSEARKWVDLEEADGLAELDSLTNRGDAGDPYPGTSSNLVFDDSTNPNSKNYSLAATGIAVSSISASGANITADLLPRPGSLGDNVSYSTRRHRSSTGYGVGNFTGYAGVRILNNTSQDQFDGVDVYIADSTGATIDVLFYTSLAGGVPSGLIHSETGFVAELGWNRLILSSPQPFAVAQERGVVLKIVTNTSNSPISIDRSDNGSGRSYIDADGSGTFTALCPGPFCSDVNVVTLLGSQGETDPPTVTSIQAVTVGPTNAVSISFNVTFSEDVVNFNDAADVIVNHSGTAHTGVGVAGTGSSYTVDVTGISGDGSFSVELNPASDIEDLAGNGLQTSPTSALVQIDNTPPQVSIGAPSTAITSTGPVTFTVTYTGADSVTLSNGDVTLNKTGSANGSVNVTGTGTTSRTVTIDGITGAGSLGVSLASGTASDSATNFSNAAGPSATFDVLLSQSITFTHPGAQNFGTSPTLTATATSGLPVSFSSTTNGVCTITSDGTLTFITTGTCTIEADQAGNSTYLPAPTVSQSFDVDAVAPGSPEIGMATAGNAEATVTFTAPLFTGGATITNYTVTSNPGGLTGAGANSPITVTGLTNDVAYTFTVTASNSVGTGPPSAASNSVTPVDVPAPEEIFTDGFETPP